MTMGKSPQHTKETVATPHDGKSSRTTRREKQPHLTMGKVAATRKEKWPHHTGKRSRKTGREKQPQHEGKLIGEKQPHHTLEQVATTHEGNSRHITGRKQQPQHRKETAAATPKGKPATPHDGESSRNTRRKK
eukprot:c20591_g1_i2.p2 GENE.c20591_g1_i2~~c20591_g1_i2.p2  ORF type:complete len:133 (-),score=4.61 c20591_g1_i2:191-589(-)